MMFPGHNCNFPDFKTLWKADDFPDFEGNFPDFEAGNVSDFGGQVRQCVIT